MGTRKWLFPDREKRAAKKLVRSWFIQGIGWYAMYEVMARALVEGASLLALWFWGPPWYVLLGGALTIHTAVWFVLYGGFMRIRIVLGMSTDLAKLEAHFSRLMTRAQRQGIFRLVFFRGSSGRREMNPRSDIDVCVVPRTGFGPKVLGILYLWSLRVESMVRRISVEARWIDRERYAPYHAINETPLVAYRQVATPVSFAEALASEGFLITFSGLDGSGKTTVARKLMEDLRREGFDATYVYGHRQAWIRRRRGPDLSFGILFESLWKRIGRRMGDLGHHRLPKVAYDVSTSLDFLYTSMRLSASLRPGRLVVADRYVADVIAYLKGWGPLKITLEGLLVGIARPPDIPLLFEISPAAALERKRENSLRQLGRFAAAYDELKGFLGLVPVDASGPIEDVVGQVRSILRARMDGDPAPRGAPRGPSETLKASASRVRS